MNQSIISLEFKYSDKIHLLSGLQLMNIETSNFFWHSQNINGSIIQANKSKSFLSLKIKGLFFSNQPQLLLQDIALNGQAFYGIIQHNKFQISGDFNIQKYQLSSEVNEMDYFDLQLTCHNKVEHKIKGNFQ